MSAELIDAFVAKYESLAGIAHVTDNSAAVAPIVVDVLQGVDCNLVVMAELPDGSCR